MVCYGFFQNKVNGILSRLRGWTVAGKEVVRFGLLFFVNEESEVFLKKPSLCHSECFPPYCLLQEKNEALKSETASFPGLSHTGFLHLSVKQAGL